MPALSNDVDQFPGMSKKWGLSFLINTQQSQSGGSAGSLSWAGLANTSLFSVIALAQIPLNQTKPALIFPVGKLRILRPWASRSRSIWTTRSPHPRHVENVPS